MFIKTFDRLHSFFFIRCYFQQVEVGNSAVETNEKNMTNGTK